jgi:hypothetical protein
VQKQSLERRHAMIDDAKALGAAAQLRVDAVKALQQRWQAEAQAIPLDRKHEQKLWDAFRKPIDEAFNRKGEERENAAAALSERDRAVLQASKSLEAANASGDAQKIKAAIAALDAALRGQAQAAAAVEAAGPAQAAPAGDAAAAAVAPAAEESGPAGSGVSGEAAATSASQGDTPASDAAGDAGAAGAPSSDAGAESGSQAQPATAPKPAPKPVIAMRGDDRPGMKKTEPMAPGRGGKFGDRKGGPGGKFGDRRDGPRDPRGDGRFGGGRFGERPSQDEDRGPRLGDAAFHAQREALEHAQMTLKKLAAQAHGEALTQLITAWEQRSSEQVPSQQELGKAVTPAVRGAWVKALGATPASDASEALLRLEIAAETPTPAEHLNARRALQLKLLTRRNDPSPAQTWGEDTASVLASPHDAATARRLQTVLKSLMRR